MKREPCPECGQPVPVELDFDTIRNLQPPVWVDEHHYARPEQGEMVLIEHTVIRRPMAERQTRQA